MNQYSFTLNLRFILNIDLLTLSLIINLRSEYLALQIPHLRIPKSVCLLIISSHCESFPATCLPINKHCGIYSSYSLRNYWLCYLLMNSFIINRAIKATLIFEKSLFSCIFPIIMFQTNFRNVLKINNNFVFNGSDDFFSFFSFVLWRFYSHINFNVFFLHNY